MKTEELAWLVRRHGFEMTHLSGGSHIGAIFSMADFMAVLYNEVLKYDPKNPKDDSRDRFVLSKGHAGAAVYACLAEEGFFPRENLKQHYQNGSHLSGHVSHIGVPGVEFSTGSLGHGVCVACGMAYALRKDNKPNRVFAVVGDGECDEGSVWETALFAANFELDNFCIVVDRNKMQSLDFTEKTIRLEPFADKWRAFGFDTQEVDGHNFDEIRKAFENIKSVKGKPHVIIMDTIKGKGVSFMENNILWHYRFPHDGDEYTNGLAELHAQMPEGLKDPYEEAK